MIRLANIHKSFKAGSGSIKVLAGLDLTIEPNDFVAIMGKSGSGKSTLLHLLGCLDYPDSGSYLLDGRDVLNASDDERSRIRAQEIGFVFQSFNLIPELTVRENVALPFLYRQEKNKEIEHLTREAIEQVGLADRLNHKMNEISGGELQRVAIARALVIKPKIILADEPTGNLDSETTRDILILFKQLYARTKATLVIITHDLDVAAHAEKVYHLENKKLSPQ